MRMRWKRFRCKKERYKETEMVVYQIIMVLLLNVIVPVLIGGLFQSDICKTRTSQLIYRYAVGFFVMLAIYQLLEVPMALCYVKFHVLVILYVIILAILVGVAVYQWRKAGTLFPIAMAKKKELRTIYDWIYLLGFLTILGYQLYHTIFYQMNEMAFDDATYLAYANDAMQADLLFLVEPYTGVYAGLSVKRLLQSSLVYPSFIAKLTGIHVTVVAHTIWPVFLVLMAYGVYYLIAEKLFEKRENQYLFLFFVALLYNYGFYSHYSTSFRLLGTIWQGKGILAVILNFLYLYLFSELYQKGYDRKMGVLMFLLSVASVALTLGGVISTAVISGVLFVLFFIKNRKWRNIIYLVWANIMPVLYAGFYLWQR